MDLEIKQEVFRSETQSNCWLGDYHFVMHSAIDVVARSIDMTFIDIFRGRSVRWRALHNSPLHYTIRGLEPLIMPLYDNLGIDNGVEVKIEGIVFKLIYNKYHENYDRSNEG